MAAGTGAEATRHGPAESGAGPAENKAAGPGITGPERVGKVNTSFLYICKDLKDNLNALNLGLLLLD